MIRLITISLYPIGYNCQYQIQKPSQNGKALVNTGSYKFINTLYGAGNGNFALAGRRNCGRLTCPGSALSIPRMLSDARPLVPASAVPSRLASDLFDSRKLTQQK